MVNHRYLNLAYIILAGLAFPILRYTAVLFSRINNNTVRFLCGGAVLLALACYKFLRVFRKIVHTPALLVRILALGLIMTGNTFFFMHGMAVTSSMTGSIVSLINMPIAIMAAAIFFADERAMVLRPRFLIASALTLAFSVVFILGGKVDDTSVNYVLGAMYFSGAIVFQSLQNIVVKSTGSFGIPSLVISSCTAVSAGLWFLLLGISSGQTAELGNYSAFLLIMLALAGVYGMVTGMFMSFTIITSQGVVVFNMLSLIIPGSTAVFSYLLLDEVLTWQQALGAIGVVISCMFALKRN